MALSHVFSCCRLCNKHYASSIMLTNLSNIVYSEANFVGSWVIQVNALLSKQSQRRVYAAVLQQFKYGPIPVYGLFLPVLYLWETANFVHVMGKPNTNMQTNWRYLTWKCRCVIRLQCLSSWLVSLCYVMNKNLMTTSTACFSMFMASGTLQIVF